jgi:endonuclease G, mitochondrial
MSSSIFAAEKILKSDSLRSDFFKTLIEKGQWNNFKLDGQGLDEQLVKYELTKYIRGFPGYLNVTSDWPMVLQKFVAPVLPIKANHFSSPSGHWSKFFENMLPEVKARLEIAIVNTGRVQLTGDLLGPYIGTAWFIGEGLMITNAHVAKEFAFGYEPYSFRKTHGQKRGGKLDMKAEEGRHETDEFEVSKVRFLKKEGDVDVAFFEVNTGQSMRAPLELSEDVVEVGDLVAVIGYPTRDQEYVGPQEALELFGDKYDFKRISLGEIVSVDANLFTHNCQTLLGNSGSPLISLKTGKVLGLHLGGNFLQINAALRSSVIKKIMTEQRW